MFNNIYVMIILIVDLLFVAGIICTMEFEVKSLETGTSGTIPCDHVGNDPDVRVVQWYKSRNIDAFENGDLSLASWTKGESESLQNNRYHIESTTFSLVIGDTTLEDEGLYKCSVERGDLFTESFYYTRTLMYALPQMDPLLTLDTDLNRVHCTVEHVKPLIYPVFNFDWIPDSTETYAVLNEDGTYTASVSCALPQSKIVLPVECSFFYLHYQRVTSLDLRDTTTDSLIEDKTTTVSPIGTSVTSEGDGSREITILSIFTAVIVSVLIVLLLVMLMKLRRKHHRDVQNSNGSKESEVKMI